MFTLLSEIMVSIILRCKTVYSRIRLRFFARREARRAGRGQGLGPAGRRNCRRRASNELVARFVGNEKA